MTPQCTVTDMADGACPQQAPPLDDLVDLLSRHAYRFSNEEQLQAAVAALLASSGLHFEREERTDARNRFDLSRAGLVIELKISGSLSAALRQIDRYAGLDAVNGIVLASTARWATDNTCLPATIRNKPIRMVRLVRQAL